MTDRRRGGLHQAATALAVVSVLTTVGAGITAGVAATRGDASDGSGTLVRGSGGPGESDSTEPGFDYSGWQLVSGQAGDSGAAATYRVPAKGWETYAAGFEVSFKDEKDKAYATGSAAGNYYGNTCKDAAGAKIAGGWTLLADTEPSGDLKGIAEDAVRLWARGYATNDSGTTAPMSEPAATDVTLDDGTTAARASIEIDMSIFGGVCLPEDAEIMVTTIDTPDGAKSLVQARYISAVGITDKQWKGISQSLTQ